jgi:hypothetical protein
VIIQSPGCPRSHEKIDEVSQDSISSLERRSTSVASDHGAKNHRCMWCLMAFSIPSFISNGDEVIRKVFKLIIIVVLVGLYLSSFLIIIYDLI